MGGLCWTLERISSQKECGIPDGAAQGGGGVTALGGV